MLEFGKILVDLLVLFLMFPAQVLLTRSAYIRRGKWLQVTLLLLPVPGCWLVGFLAYDHAPLRELPALVGLVLHGVFFMGTISSVFVAPSTWRDLVPGPRPQH